MARSGNETVEPVSEWKELSVIGSAEVPTLEHQISGLTPRTSYEIEIVACNDIGCSDANERFVFTTFNSKSV